MPSSKTGGVGGAVRVPFGSLDADYRSRRVEIDAAVSRVLSRGRFILGEEVAAFERELAAFVRVREAIACASGTDAIAIALQAAGAGPEDEVLLPANSCTPVIAAVRLAGARPRLADVDRETLTLSRATAEPALGPKVRFVLAVHLYGGLADLVGLGDLAKERRLTLLEDCAQSIGAEKAGRRAGSFGAAAAFSFYPTKNLGAYGDAGAIATSEGEIARRARLLRQYGWSRRDFAEIEGRNSRMDELQAAILRAKLPLLEADNDRRRAIARRYDEGLSDLPVSTLAKRPDTTPAPHLYPIRAAARDALREHLSSRGIETAVHYPVPLHRHPAYAFLGHRAGDFPVSEEASATVLSLPLYPTLTEEQVNAVISEVRAFFETSE